MDEKISVIEALEMIASERGLGQDEVKEILINSILEVIENMYGVPVDRISIEMGKKRGTLKIYVLKDVVDEVEEGKEGYQITVEDANSLKKGVFNVGDKIKIYMPMEEFSRSAINKIKHAIFQKVREKEKSKQIEYYRQKIGEVITASIDRIPRTAGDITIKLEKIDGILPYEEQIRGDKLDYMRNKIKVYVKCVVDSWEEYYKIREEEEKHLIEIRRPSEQLKKYRERRRGPFIILSRSDNNFIRARLKAEVPEIQDGIVEIKAIARIPGKRAKVAVYSRDPMVDPQGACIGRGGSRIKSIVRELGGENIDIIEWTEEKVLFVKRSLAPAQTIGVYLLEDNVVLIVVEDDKYPQAIGKDGMNVKLASALTGMEINIIKRSDFREDLIIAEIRDIEEIEDLTEAEKKALVDAGYMTVDDVAKVGIEGIMKIKGIGKKKAEKIYQIIMDEKKKIEEIRKEKKQFLADYLQSLEEHKEKLRSQGKEENEIDDESSEGGAIDGEDQDI